MILENDSPYKQATSERRSRISNPMPYSGLGKLPPQATDLEEAILGAIMLERDAYLEISEFLRGDCFYRDNHQKIFHACGVLFQAAKPIDILTVTAQLRQVGELEMIGGAFYITELTNRVASAANIQFHGRIVYQKYLQRELIRISTEVINTAYEDTTDVLELLEKNQLELFNLSSNHQGKQVNRIDSIIDAAIKEMDTPVVNGLTGIGTGFKPLNDFCAGWQKGELYILAARPAMGKTALMMQWVRNAAVLHDVPVGVFSLEMSERQLVKRMISNEAEVFLEKINKRSLNQFDRQELDGRLALLKQAPIFVDDEPAISIVAFRSKAIRLKRLYNIQLIVIDYLQLMEGHRVNGQKNGNRDQEIGQITRGLKSVAKELNIPVIALSQLSRTLESRPGGGKRPQLQDLRESGNIEQDADNVMFLYRPEYYGLTADEKGTSTAMMAELIWAKHRNGATGTIYMKFRGAVMRFQDWDTPEPTQQATNFIIRPTSDNEQDELPF